MSIATLPLSPVGPAGYHRNVFIHTHDQGCLIHNNADSPLCHVSVLVPVRLTQASDRLALSMLKQCLLTKSDNYPFGHLQSYFASTMASIPTVEYLKGFSGLAFSYSFRVRPDTSHHKKFTENIAKQLLILLSHIFYPGEFDLPTASVLQRICEDYDDTAILAVIDDQFHNRGTLVSLQSSIRLDRSFPLKVKDITKKYFNTVVRGAPFIVLVSTSSNVIPLVLGQAIKAWCTRSDAQTLQGTGADTNTDADTNFGTGTGTGVGSSTSGNGEEKRHILQGDGLRRGYQYGHSAMKNKPVSKELEEDRKQLAKLAAHTPILFVQKCDSGKKHVVDIVLTTRRYTILNLFDITLGRLLFEWLEDGNCLMDAILTYSNSAMYLMPELRALPVHLREFFTGRYYNLQCIIRNVPLLLADILSSILSSFDLMKNVLKYLASNIDSFSVFLRRRQIESAKAYADSPHQALLDEALPHMVSFLATNSIANLKTGFGLVQMEDVYGPVKLLKKGESLRITIFDIWQRDAATEHIDSKPQLIDSNQFLNTFGSASYLYDADASLIVVVSSSPATKSSIFGQSLNSKPTKRSNSVSTSHLESSMSKSILVTGSKMSGHGDMNKEYSGKAPAKMTGDNVDSTLASTFITQSYERFCFTFFAALGITQRVATMVSSCHESLQSTMNQFVSTLFCGYWAVTLIGNKSSDFIGSLMESFKVSQQPGSSKSFNNVWFYYLRGQTIKFSSEEANTTIYPHMLAIKPFECVPYISVPLAISKLSTLASVLTTMHPWTRDVAGVAAMYRYVTISGEISAAASGSGTETTIFSEQLKEKEKDVLLKHFGRTYGQLLLSLDTALSGAAGNGAPSIKLNISAQQKNLDKEKLIQHLSVAKEIIDDAAIFALSSAQSSIFCAKHSNAHILFEPATEAIERLSSCSPESPLDFLDRLSELAEHIIAHRSMYLPKLLPPDIVFTDIEAFFTLQSSFRVDKIFSSGVSTTFLTYLTTFIDILNFANRRITFALDASQRNILVTVRAVTLSAFLETIDAFFNIIMQKQLMTEHLELFNLPGGTEEAKNMLLLLNSLFMGQNVQIHLNIHLSNFSLEVQPSSNYRNVVPTFNHYKQLIGYLITVVAVARMHNCTKNFPSVIPLTVYSSTPLLYSKQPSHESLLDTVSFTFSMDNVLSKNTLLTGFLEQGLLVDSLELRQYLLHLTSISLEYIFSRVPGIHRATSALTGAMHRGVCHPYATLELECTNAELSKVVTLLLDGDEDNNVSSLMKGLSDDLRLFLATQALFSFPNLFVTANVQHLSALLFNYYTGFPAALDVLHGIFVPSTASCSDMFAQHFMQLPSSSTGLFERPETAEYLRFVRKAYVEAAEAQTRLRLTTLQSMQTANSEAAAKNAALLSSAELSSTTGPTSDDCAFIEFSTQLAQRRAYRKILEQQLEAISQRDDAVTAACQNSYTSTKLADLTASLRAKGPGTDQYAHAHKLGDPQAIASDDAYNHRLIEFLFTIFNIQLERKGIYTINGFPIWFKHTDMNVFTGPLAMGLNLVHPSHSVITKKHEFFNSLPRYVLHLSKNSSQIYFQETAMWYAMHLQLALSLAKNIPLRHEVQLAGLHSRIINRTIGLIYPVGVPIVHGCNVYFRDSQSTVASKSIIRGPHSKIFSYIQDAHGQQVEAAGPVVSLGPETVSPFINFQICTGMVIENAACIAYHLGADISMHAGRKAPADPTEYLFYLYRDCLAH